MIHKNMDEDELYPPAAERTGILPGIEVNMSFAALKGLTLDGKESILEVLSTEGFSVYPAGRFNGIVRPLQQDLSLDTRGDSQ